MTSFSQCPYFCCKHDHECCGCCDGMGVNSGNAGTEQSLSPLETGLVSMWWLHFEANESKSQGCTRLSNLASNYGIGTRGSQMRR